MESKMSQRNAVFCYLISLGFFSIHWSISLKKCLILCEELKKVRNLSEVNPISEHKGSMFKINELAIVKLHPVSSEALEKSGNFHVLLNSHHMLCYL